MYDIKFDGECHAISNKQGYIANMVEPVKEKLEEMIDEQLQTYAEYLYEFDSVSVLDLLVNLFRSQVRNGVLSEDYILIFRPPHYVSCLADKGTLCIRFERSENDNLDEKDAESRKCCCR